MTTTTQAIERSSAPGKELTLELVREMTGYDLAQIAMIRLQMASGVNRQPKDISLQDVAMFLHAAKQLDLDPLLRQVHWISRGGKGTLQVGIDGYRSIAERSGVYAGSEPPVFRGWIEQSCTDDKGRAFVLTVPERAQVTVWKLIGGQKCAFTGEANWTEFYPGQKEGFMYRKMPKHMLAKDAEAQALRKAFPAMLSRVEYAAAVGGVPEVAEVAPPERSEHDSARPALNEAPSPQPRCRSYEEIFGTEEARDRDGVPPATNTAVSVTRRTVNVETGEVLDEHPDDQPVGAGSAVPSSRSELWQENRRLVAKAHDLGITGRTLNVRVDEDVIAAANAELQTRIAQAEREACG